jgi:uncharacterized protein (TIGR03435 family)
MNTDKKKAVFVAGAGLLSLTLLSFTAVAQSSQGTATVKFEILSIRPMSGPLAGINTNPTPNGFESSLTLYQAIMVAYGPVSAPEWSSVEVLNAPAWTGEFYDFKARVSQADLTAWQNQSKEHELLRSAMRAALRERCKLAIHEQPAKGEIFELVVKKGGPHLKAPTPDSALPAGFRFPSGGIAMGKIVSGKTVRDWYAASMEDLAAFCPQWRNQSLYVTGRA